MKGEFVGGLHELTKHKWFGNWMLTKFGMYRPRQEMNRRWARDGQRVYFV